MFDLTWEIHDLDAVGNEGRSLYTEIAAVLDLCNPTSFQAENIPRKLSKLRKRLTDMHKRVVRFRRIVATHLFVLMISSELRDKKPYAVPVQCVPYAGLKEEDIRRLISELTKELVNRGLNVAGK